MEQWDAVIHLLVLDLSRELTLPVIVPFVIDTGTDVTLIPRKLLPKAAFPRERAVWPFEMPPWMPPERFVVVKTFPALERNASLCCVPVRKCHASAPAGRL